MKKLIVLVAVMLVLSNVASAAVITSVDRSGGHADTKDPFGTFNSEDDPWVTSLADDIYVFCDRDNFKLQETPIDLVGADYVQTFNNDKKVTTVTYTMTTSVGAIIAVGLDDRFGGDQQSIIDHITSAIVPAGTFTDLGYDLKTTEDNPETLSLFGTLLPAGTYVFEGTDQNSNNFMVLGAMIPEPATLALLGFGGLAMLRRKR